MNATKIESKIMELETERDAVLIVPEENNRIMRQTVNAQIRALRWALGEDIGKWYWCVACNLFHEGLVCPLCGDAEYIGVVDRK